MPSSRRSTRSRSAYDFKGTKASIEFDKKENKVTMLADHKGQLETVIQMLKEKMARRGVPVERADQGQARGGLARHGSRDPHAPHRHRTDDARKIVKDIKQLKIKVQAQIMDDKVRVTGKKIDELAGRDRLSQGARTGIPTPIRQLHLIRARRSTSKVEWPSPTALGAGESSPGRRSTYAPGLESGQVDVLALQPAGTNTEEDRSWVS